MSNTLSTPALAGIAVSLEQVDALLNCALRNVKQQCSPTGKFEPQLLDAHQLVSYQLAFCAAELAAAASIYRYAPTAAQQDPLAAELAGVFCAQILPSIVQRLLAHSSELSLVRSEVSACLANAEFNSLTDHYANGAVLDALGAELLQRGHSRLPSLLDEEKEMVRDSFARFADEVVQPLAADIHRQDLDIPESIIHAAAELGCFGTCIPQRFGGLLPDDRGDCLGMIVVTEELSRASLGAAGSLITRPEIAARALLAGGTPAQQDYWLPRLASAETLCAIAVTEPDFGSDVASVALKATPSEGGSGWILNGAKTWCTFAGRAQLLVTLARTDPDSSRGHRGLSLFLVEKPAFEGHSFKHQQPDGGTLSATAIDTIGYRGMHSFDLHFDNYHVPASSLLGEQSGQGFYHAMAGFAGGRIQTAARANGVMQAALDAALSYAADRKVFGATLGSYQLTRARLANMLATLNASRQFSYAVAQQLDAGEGQMQASLVKLFSCRAAETLTRDAMQMHGGMGYAEESAVSRYFVDARVLSIFEGAEETLALKVIARDLIANCDAEDH